MENKKSPSLEDCVRLLTTLNRGDMGSDMSDVIVRRDDSKDFQIGKLLIPLGDFKVGSYMVFAPNDTSFTPDSHRTYTAYIPSKGNNFSVFSSVQQSAIQMLEVYSL